MRDTRQRTEDTKQWTVHTKTAHQTASWAVYSKQWIAQSRHQTLNSEQWAVDVTKQWTSDSQHQTMNSGQRIRGTPTYP